MDNGHNAHACWISTDINFTFHSLSLFLIFLPEFVILVLYYSIIFHFHKSLIIYTSPPLPEISKNFKHSLRSMSSDFLLYIINYSGLTITISQIIYPVSDVQIYSVIFFIKLHTNTSTYNQTKLVLNMGNLCQFYHVPQNCLWLIVDNTNVSISNCRIHK